MALYMDSNNLIAFCNNNYNRNRICTASSIDTKPGNIIVACANVEQLVLHRKQIF